MPDLDTLIKVAALVISILALLFTIFAFWWLNYRRGWLRVGPPRSFALSNSNDGLLLVQLPLVLFNDGAAAQVVQNLRLRLEQEGRSSPVLHFNNTTAKLGTSENREWARQFAIEGRKTTSPICVFQNKPVAFHFATGQCKAVLEGKLNESRKWRVLVTFDLQVPAQSVSQMNGGALLAYDNDPDR